MSSHPSFDYDPVISTDLNHFPYPYTRKLPTVKSRITKIFQHVRRWIKSHRRSDKHRSCNTSFSQTHHLRNPNFDQVCQLLYSEQNRQNELLEQNQFTLVQENGQRYGNADIESFVRQCHCKTKEIIDTTSMTTNDISLASQQNAFDDSDYHFALVTSHFGLVHELGSLIDCGWYWGALGRHRAERLLSSCEPGYFLLRDSGNDGHLLSLSFRTEFGVFHSRIEHSNGQFSFSLSPTTSYTSVLELINETMEKAQRGIFLYTAARSQPLVFPVRLLKPLSRHSQTQSP